MKSVIGCLFLCFLLITASETSEHNSAWIRLGTLWDSPGIITASPASDYAVIKSDDTSRVIHILSGEVWLEVEHSSVEFSDTGRHVFYFEYPDRSSYITESHVLNLQTGYTYSVEGAIDQYRSDERFVVSTQRIPDERNGISRLYEIETGQIIAEYSGSIIELSHDLSLVVVFTYDETLQTVQVIELASGEQVAAFTYPVPDHMFFTGAAFNADDSLLSLYFFPEEMQIISTDTWEILYTLERGIVFSVDGKYIAHNDHEGYSDVQLIEAHTGKVLDEYLGAIYFTRDRQYWIRGEAIDYDLRHWQIINIDTNEVVFEDTRIFGVPQLIEDNLVAIWSFEKQSTQFYELETNRLVREIEGGAERFGNYVIVESATAHFSYLQNWDTGETYATGTSIKMLPDRTLALVSNELSVDVYGPADMNTTEVPPRSE